MAVKIPKRIATSIINSLRGGVVPRIGLGYIAVGREAEINALLNDVEIINDGGATFRFIVGKYGSGKSFLLQTIRSHVMDRGFVVVDADLSPDRRLKGGNNQGLATYRELIQNMSTKTKPDGGALPLILEKWIAGIKMEVINSTSYSEDSDEFSNAVNKKIFAVISELQDLVNGFDFARLISVYWNAYKNDDDIAKANVLKWFRGEYQNKTEAKRDLGISVIINDENWYEYIKIFALFLVRAGYKGLLMLIDELINIYKIPNSVPRQYNYEKILMMYNDTLQGKAKYLGIIMGGTPQSIEDTRRGVFSYEALRSRLETGKFADSNTKDLLSPIIKLKPLTNEEIYVLIEKLAGIHAYLYSYEQKIVQSDMLEFIKFEFNRIGAGQNITPREIIRDFIEILNIIYQNPEKTMGQILGSDDIEFAENTVTDEKIHEDFVEFQL